MAIKDQLETENEQGQAGAQLNDSEEKDLSIMVNIAKSMIDDEGIKVIKSAENSKDQGQVIGQFLFQLGSTLAEKLSGTVDISPRIMLAEGGWVEQVSDYLQETYGVPKDVMDRAEIYVAQSAQQMSQAQQAPQQGAAAPAPPAPAMPQQGAM